MARSPASSRVLTDHDEIRRWAEERGAKPARVKGTGGDGDVGIIRLDFPGYTGEDSLEPISWDDWFRKFDESNLALIVQDTTARGQKSNFNKLVSRETLEELSEGRRPARRHSRASANGRGRTRSQGRGRRSASSRSRSSQSSGGSRSSRSGRSKTSSRSGGSGSNRGKKSSRSSRSAGTRSQGGNRGSRRNVVIEVECAPEQSRTSRSRTTARSTSGKKSSSRASSGRRKAA